MAGEDPRLVRLTAICLALPEAVRRTFDRQADFRVRDRPFAYWLDDHHGDGIVAVAVKAPKGENTLLVEAEPERFYLPAYVGRQGWVALRVDRGEVDWSEVEELVRESWRVAAPKRLAAQLDAGEG